MHTVARPNTGQTSLSFKSRTLSVNSVTEYMEKIMASRIFAKLNCVFALVALAVAFVRAEPAIADAYVGVDLGFAQADMKAEQTASRLATLSGSTVTYIYDEAVGYLRGYIGLPINEMFGLEGGYFNTGSLDATYTITGASATESYDADGFDLTAIIRGNDFKKGGIYGRAGLHFSELSGAASITIGGTTYNIASQSASGTGTVFGGGYELEKSADGTAIRVGIDFYSTIGGLDDADFTLFYAGFMF